MKNHVHVNNKGCVRMKHHKKVTGGDIPLLLSHVLKHPHGAKLMDEYNNKPLANSVVGIASKSIAKPNLNVGPKKPEPEMGGTILQTDPMKLLKTIKFKGKGKNAKEKDTIKIVF